MGYCRVGCFVAAMVAVTALTPLPPDQLRILAAVEFYQVGDWRRAIDSLNTQNLTAAQFTGALDSWISAVDAEPASRRRVVAAAFALDTVWAATRRGAHVAAFDPPPNETALLESRAAQGAVATWVARQMPAAGAVTAVERALWMAAIGTAEDGSAWRAVHMDILPLARKRLPDEPRVRLATVVASASVGMGLLRSHSTWSQNLNWTVLREEHLTSGVTGHIPGAIRSLEDLLMEPSLAGEVELRIGYLELRRRHWPDALARFEAARAKTMDERLRATADYLAGWVHEQRGQPDDAIAAYRRALIPFPTVRNLATRLSALLFLRDERTMAYAILDRALNAGSIPVDLMVSLERGDGWMVEDWIASVRQAPRGRPGF